VKWVAVVDKPKIGWFCTYTPLEILEAAGLMPYGIREDSGKGHEDVYLGDSICSYVRSCIGGALTGSYDFLDGVVIAHSCECMRRLYDIWVYKQDEIKPKCVFFLDVPRINTESSREYFTKSIQRFKEALEERYGKISVQECIRPSAGDDLRRTHQSEARRGR
jgi:benzoyl-CoA reductase/2-hydroxyglutaryl-CoA dehydratase subunit BcrC/BadD/HgdB